MRKIYSYTIVCYIYCEWGYHHGREYTVLPLCAKMQYSLYWLTLTRGPSLSGNLYTKWKVLESEEDTGLGSWRRFDFFVYILLKATCTCWLYTELWNLATYIHFSTAKTSSLFQVAVLSYANVNLYIYLIFCVCAHVCVFLCVKLSKLYSKWVATEQATLNFFIRRHNKNFTKPL